MLAAFLHSAGLRTLVVQHCPVRVDSDTPDDRSTYFVEGDAVPNSFSSHGFSVHLHAPICVSETASVQPSAFSFAYRLREKELPRNPAE